MQSYVGRQQVGVSCDDRQAVKAVIREVSDPANGDRQASSLSVLRLKHFPEVLFRSSIQL